MSIKFVACERAWMGIALCVLLLLFGNPSVAQQRLPVIHARSTKVDVRDGDMFQKGVWNLSPEINPDIYFCLPSEKKRRVTFYTDIDSVSFDVEHNTSYDFLIVLNGTDTCYTRISGGQPMKRIVRSVLAPGLLQEDFTILVDALQKEHGDITRYQTKEELKDLCKRLFQKLDHPMDQFEFYTIVCYLISAIQNGHTGSSLPPELLSDYEEKVKMFPLQLWFTEQKAFVACHKYEDIPVGTEIYSVNGVPVNKIKDRLFQYIKSDGKIESKKYLMLNYAGFPYLFNWVYGETDAYTIRYANEDGTVSSKTLKSDFIKSSQCLKIDRKFEENLKLQILQNNTALLTIRSFYSKELTRTGEDFVRFIETSFKKIDSLNVKTLIVDLRNNAGGDDAYAALLYSYLVDKPFYFYTLTKQREQQLAPNELNFKGRVIFMINGLSFSAASNFAAIAKSNERGVLVGEETGGAYYGGAAGENYVAVLPNTHIRVTIPKERYDNPVTSIPEKGSGVIPDYLVKPTLENIIQNEDVQLQFVLKLGR